MKDDQGKHFVGYPIMIQEAIYQTEMRPKGGKVFHFICRKTFGWNKAWDGISQKKFKSGTGIKSNFDLQKEIDILEWQGLIIIRKYGPGKRTLYRINPDVKKWRSWNSKEYCEARKITRPNLSTTPRAVPREKRTDQNLSTTPRAVPREKAKKEKTEAGDRSKPIVDPTSASLSSTPRAEPIVDPTSAHPKEILIKDTISKDTSTDRTFNAQIQTAKDLLKRKQAELETMAEILATGNLKGQRLNKLQREAKTAAFNIAGMERSIREAENGKPITAKNEILKNVKTMSRKADIKKPAKDPKPKAKESDFLESAKAALKETSKPAGFKPHERTERMKEL